jgi:hypothetical protein
MNPTVGLPAQTVTADAEGYAREVLAMVDEAIVIREDWEAQQAVVSDVVLIDVQT